MVARKASSKKSTTGPAKAPRPKPKPIIKIPPSISLPSSVNTTNQNPINPSPPVQEEHAPLQPSAINPQMTSGPPNPGPAENLLTSTGASGSIQAPSLTRAEESTSSMSATTALAQEALVAKLAIALAEIDRLKKQESAAKSKELPELKRPAGRITDLQKAMGLDDERAVYVSCRATVRDVMALGGVSVNTVWRKQEPLLLARVTALAKSRNPQLGRYEHGWATLEIMRTFCKNQRHYRKKIGRSTNEIAADDEDGEEQEEEEQEQQEEEEQEQQEEEEQEQQEEEVDDGAGAGGAGKRRKAAQGGSRKKARA